MDIRPSPEKPEELVGAEQQMQLPGEVAPRFHGALTSKVYEILVRADTIRETVGDLESSLKTAFGNAISVKVSEAARGRLILTDDIASRASELIVDLDEQRAREIIDGLEDVIMRREQRGDYWPEGRMNLGIAYACLGEYEEARRWLDDAVNMFAYPSYIPRSEEMLA